MSELDEIKNNIAHLDNRIKPSFEMLSPNQDHTIFMGQFQLIQNQKENIINGELKFSWFPSPGVKFQGKVISGHINDTSLDEKAEVKLEGLHFGWCHISNKSHHLGREADSGVFIEGSFNGGVATGDTSVSVEKIQFSIPNLREYFGQTVKEITEDQINTDNARLKFENSEYLITIDKAKNYSELFKDLKAKSGFVILYGGEITRRKGSVQFNELGDLLYCFNNFLYFLDGRRTSLYFLSGKFQDEEIWRDYTGYNIAPFQNVKSWSRMTGTEGFNELWQSFNSLWKEEKNRNFLELLIHWYVEANNQSGYVEGSIILIQTALELIYNWLIVENKKIILGDDAQNLSAANKIRIILSQLRIDSQIPTALSDLMKLDDIVDGPEALVSVRNALVHGQERKRAKVMAIPVHTKYEALQLGLWYVELSVLYILDYKGKYCNRVSGNLFLSEGDPLPWQK